MGQGEEMVSSYDFWVLKKKKKSGVWYYCGCSLAGMFLMFCGLYFVLWAKGKEGYCDGSGYQSDDFDLEKPLLSWTFKFTHCLLIYYCHFFAFFSPLLEKYNRKVDNGMEIWEGKKKKKKQRIFNFDICSLSLVFDS